MDRYNEFLTAYIRDTTSIDHQRVECYVLNFETMYRKNSIEHIETQLYGLMKDIHQETTDPTKHPKYY